MCRRARYAWIDHNEISVFKFSALEQVLQRHRTGLGWIAAHNDLRLRVANIVEPIGHCTLASGIRDRCYCHRMANRCLMVGIVGAPESTQFAEEVGSLIGEFRRAEPVDRIRTRLLADERTAHRVDVADLR